MLASIISSLFFTIGVHFCLNPKTSEKKKKKSSTWITLVCPRCSTCKVSTASSVSLRRGFLCPEPKPRLPARLRGTLVHVPREANPQRDSGSTHQHLPGAGAAIWPERRTFQRR